MSTTPAKIIPVSILTGFLGAGKTTLLNYILKQQRDYKFAIIVNEIGKIGIDGQLVENAKDEMLEMSNGCVCCTVRKDLVKGIQKLLKKGGFDYILIETTGIADPGPVAQTFTNIPALQKFVRLDSIITVVDAEQIFTQMKNEETAREQVVMADYLLLNKVDLVDEAQLAKVEAEFARLNPEAQIFRTDHSQVNLKELLDMHVFDLDQKLRIDPNFQNEIGTRHHHDIQSHSFLFDAPFNVDRLQQWIEDLSKTEKVYRSKGILSLSGHPRRAIFHGVNNRFSIFWDRLWEASEKRESQLVFIGRDLDATRIKTGLERCLG